MLILLSHFHSKSGFAAVLFSIDVKSLSSHVILGLLFVKHFIQCKNALHCLSNQRWLSRHKRTSFTCSPARVLQQCESSPSLSVPLSRGCVQAGWVILVNTNNPFYKGKLLQHALQRRPGGRIWYESYSLTPKGR